jgi:DnaJ-class molecular chaperone
MTNNTEPQAALAQPTSADYAMGYADGFNDGCKPKPKQQQAQKQEPCKICNGSGLVETGIGMIVCDECKGITGITLRKREWVGLTAEERLEIWTNNETAQLIIATEAKLRDKNT